MTGDGCCGCKMEKQDQAESAFLSAYTIGYADPLALYGNMRGPNTPIDDAADEGILAGKTDRAAGRESNPHGAWTKSAARHT